MSKKLICVVSGKTTIVTDEYYNKRIKDFQTEERLKELYVCRQVKNFLKRGYSLKEIRENLKVAANISIISEKTIESILALEEDTGFIDGSTGTQKSDPDVAAFISRIKL